MLGFVVPGFAHLDGDPFHVLWGGVALLLGEAEGAEVVDVVLDGGHGACDEGDEAAVVEG